MAELKRKKGENFETFLRRFNRALKNSGRLFKARKSIYNSKKKTKRQNKLFALHGMKVHKEMDYLRKTGKIKEDGNHRKR